MEIQLVLFYCIYFTSVGSILPPLYQCKVSIIKLRYFSHILKWVLLAGVPH